MVVKSMYYLFEAALLGLATVLVIPKEIYRRLFIYGLFFGGVLDILRILIFEPLGLIKYHNLGPFSVFGLFSFFEPIAWIFVFMLFLYFLPNRKHFMYLYVLVYALFAYMFGFVQRGLGLFSYNGAYIYMEPLILLLMYSASAWAYIKFEHLEIK